jgi:hypothetical protein
LTITKERERDPADTTTREYEIEEDVKMKEDKENTNSEPEEVIRLLQSLREGGREKTREKKERETVFTRALSCPVADSNKTETPLTSSSSSVAMKTEEEETAGVVSK